METGSDPGNLNFPHPLRPEKNAFPPTMKSLLLFFLLHDIANQDWK